MKLIMVWGDDNPGTENLFKTLARHGHEVAYWVGLEGGKKYSPPGAIFHLHDDAWDGKPAKEKEYWMVPPTADMIEKFYRVESITLTMMDKHFDTASVGERKRVYYNLLGYWNKVLDETRPDAVLCPSLPHGVYNYVLWELAKARGIRTICFEEVWFMQSLVEYEDFWKGNEELQAAVARNLKKGITYGDLSMESRLYLDAQAKTAKPPEYMDAQKAVAVGLGLIGHRGGILVRSILSGTVFSLVGSYLKRLFQRNLTHEYSEVVGKADLSAPFVYFALPMQPERTTSPQGGIFHDQILTAQMLSSALPRGWKLYIKEHPSQWWLRTKTRFNSARYPGFYKKLADIPHVEMMPMNVSNYELISRAKCVSVVNGTPGWEALIRGKPAVLFGIPWYRDCPGVLHVSSTEECHNALKKVADGYSPRKEGLYAFVKALEETCVDAYLEDHRMNASEMRKSVPESIQSLADHLCRRLQA